MLLKRNIKAIIAILLNNIDISRLKVTALESNKEIIEINIIIKVKLRILIYLLI